MIVEREPVQGAQAAQQRDAQRRARRDAAPDGMVEAIQASKPSISIPCVRSTCVTPCT